MNGGNSKRLEQAGSAINSILVKDSADRDSKAIIRLRLNGLDVFVTEPYGWLSSVISHTVSLLTLAERNVFCRFVFPWYLPTSQKTPHGDLDTHLSIFPFNISRRRVSQSALGLLRPTVLAQKGRTRQLWSSRTTPGGRNTSMPVLKSWTHFLLFFRPSMAGLSERVHSGKEKRKVAGRSCWSRSISISHTSVGRLPWSVRSTYKES